MADFNMETITALLNGTRIEGWSDDEDALSFPDLELFNDRAGGDGLVAYFARGERGGEVTIKLMPNSPTRSLLMRHIQQFQTDRTIHIYKLVVIDEENGTTVTCNNGRLKMGPLGQTQGMEAAANANFTFRFQDVIPDWSRADYSPG